MNRDCLSFIGDSVANLITCYPIETSAVLALLIAGMAIRTTYALYQIARGKR